MSILCLEKCCNNQAYSRGLCSMHYQRFKKTGDIEINKKAPDGARLDWVMRVALQFKNKKKCLVSPFGPTRSEGRVVCRKVRGKAPTKEHHVLHSCGKGHTGCCSPHHVYWGTPKENAADRTKHGTENIGARNGLSKLNDKIVRRILTLIDKGYTDTQIARKFKVTSATIFPIRSGKGWKHIPRNSVANDNRIEIGTAGRGEHSHVAKLTDDKVRRIRSLIAKGYTQRYVASKFSVTSGTIRAIITGKTWAHVKSAT